MEFLKAAHVFRFGTARNVRNNDFFADRLSHRHTTKVLLVFVVLASFKRFFSSPVSCWVPAELRRYEKFINRYCWLKGTYYVDQTYEANTLSIEARAESLLHYYQWIYFFLIFQAFLFYAPRILWHFVSGKLLDYDLVNMVDAAIKHDSYSYNQSKILTYLSATMTHAYGYWTSSAESERTHRLVADSAAAANQPSAFRTIGRRLSKCVLTFSYVMVKALYLLNAMMQIYMMNALLSSKRHAFYGFEVLQTILRGEADLVQKSDSKIFPRITVCDVKTNELGTEHVHTVQCILSFNLFNERIYAFLWFWIFCVVVPFTLIDLAKWTVRLVAGSALDSNYRFVKQHVKIYNAIDSDEDKRLLKLFVDLYLGVDGLFIFRLLEHNSNSIVVSDLISKMWRQFKEDHGGTKLQKTTN